MLLIKETIVSPDLKAFGPASVQDMQVWSGLTRIREVVERLRPKLGLFVDSNGVELFYLPVTRLPGPETPAPVRFLAEFDNMLLSFQDRTRIMADERRKRIFTINGIIKAAILIDGFVQGLWEIDLHRNSTTLLIEPLRQFSNAEKEDLELEGAKLLQFAAGEHSHKIRFTPGLF